MNIPYAFFATLLLFGFLAPSGSLSKEETTRGVIPSSATIHHVSIHGEVAWFFGTEREPYVLGEAIQIEPTAVGFLLQDEMLSRHEFGKGVIRGYGLSGAKMVVAKAVGAGTPAETVYFIATDDFGQSWSCLGSVDSQIIGIKVFPSGSCVAWSRKSLFRYAFDQREWEKATTLVDDLSLKRNIVDNDPANFGEMLFLLEGLPSESGQRTDGIGFFGESLALKVVYTLTSKLVGAVLEPSGRLWMMIQNMGRSSSTVSLAEARINTDSIDKVFEIEQAVGFGVSDGGDVLFLTISKGTDGPPFNKELIVFDKESRLPISNRIPNFPKRKMRDLAVDETGSAAVLGRDSSVRVFLRGGD